MFKLFGFVYYICTFSCVILYVCAREEALYYMYTRSSGAVHSVFLINVYLDLESPGGSGFGWGRIEGLLRETGRVSLQASGNRGGRILTQKEGSK